MFKKLFLLLIFLYCFSAFSQKELSLDSLFSKEKVTSYLYYYQDISNQETIKTIQEKPLSFFEYKTFPGESE